MENQNHHRKNEAGALFVIATPIGNLEDISRRAVRILSEVALIASEDTRQTRKLLSHLGISTPLVSYYKDLENVRAEQVLECLAGGQDVALVSDAGTPGISDPGRIVVREAHNRGIRVVPVPGPSALATALSVTGLEIVPFVFFGFLPAQPAERRKMLRELASETKTLVFFEAPHRLVKSLNDGLELLGDRQVFMGRELTKVYEELFSGTISELLDRLSKKEVKGEIVLILKGAEELPRPPVGDVREVLLWYKEQGGLSLRDAVRQVSQDLGVARAEVYRLALEIWG